MKILGMPNQHIFLVERSKIFMDRKHLSYRGYILAASLGAVGGGIFVAAITKAIPKMTAKMMSRMMAEMGAGECDPAEI
jgi:hypothetical protein